MLISKGKNCDLESIYNRHGKYNASVPCRWLNVWVDIVMRFPCFIVDSAGV